MEKKFYDKIICADGFKMSVQAGFSNYCTPREDYADRYDAVEVGYPSEREELLMPYAEEPDSPTATVYGYVPSETVFLVCTKHGGIVTGELPPGIPYLPA